MNKVANPIGLDRLYAEEGRRAVLWLPVLLGVGVWAYFALPQEPDWRLAALPLLPAAVLMIGRARRRFWLLAPALGGCAVALGFAAAMVEARSVAAPVLAGAVEETVDGRVIARSRSASGAPRVLLDRLILYGVDPRETPARVRVALVDTPEAEVPSPGRRIRVYARLLPPGGPVEPGGFDFRRKAYFERLGGVGYAKGPVLDLGPAQAGGWGDRAALWLAGVRTRLADALMAALPGPQGAFAAAIVTGDRSGIAEEDNEALRAANLSHLLAISGLHMGILTGLVFAALRVGLALWPGVALRHPIKKYAAAAAIVAGAAYLAVAGATVATQRAFIMAAVVFVAVMLDRPAITLRALAVAAAIILLIHPISLLNVGSQMSFAATTALVACYEEIRRRAQRRHGPAAGLSARLGRRVALYAGGLMITSVVAGLATAPFAAFHFNRLAPYGLPANLAAVPAMGLVIAPAAIGAAVAAPIGLADAPLAAMGAGIGWVLAVAHEVAGWEGAYRPVAAAPASVLPLVALGGLWLLLWRGPWRFCGLGAVGLALMLWGAGTQRPDVLIAPGARLIGVMGPEGRAVDHARAQSFAAETWLEADGAPADQADAAARPGLEHGRGWARAPLGAHWRLEVVHGNRPEPDRLRALCGPGVVLIARHGPPVEGPCRYIGEIDLAAGGSAAVFVDGAEISVRWARSPGRDRAWAPALSQPAISQ